MSNLNQNQPEQTLAIFSKTSLRFGRREDVNKIQTYEFLEASALVVTLVGIGHNLFDSDPLHTDNIIFFAERMGKVFAPLKHDMNGNITKINKKYVQNTVAYEYIEDMILAEKIEGGMPTVDALQWLRRALHFIARLFESILEDANAGNNQQNLTPFFKIAYGEILERYHGWMGSQLFNILCRFAPNRKELFQILSTGNTYKDECVLRDMEVFKTHLLVCVEHLINFYSEHNLENHARV